MEKTEEQKQQILKDLWYKRNPAHDKDSAGVDRFWGTVICVFNDYNKALTLPIVSTRLYYTEYPTREFKADSDEAALAKTKAKVVYRESDSETGAPFIMLRDEIYNVC